MGIELDTIVKVGGSLLARVDALKVLCKKMDEVSASRKLALVPGGGTFADEVRLQDRRFNLSAQITHKMAILAMDQYGLLLNDLIVNSVAASLLNEVIKIAQQGKLPIILPSKNMFKPNPLEASWDVTSDTISAYLGERLRAKRLILITDVDGLFTQDPKLNPKAELIPFINLDDLARIPTRTCIDKSLHSQLRRYPLQTWIVNGIHPDRVSVLLRGEEVVSTKIVVKT